jgi:hypothetical protein
MESTHVHERWRWEREHIARRTRKQSSTRVHQGRLRVHQGRLATQMRERHGVFGVRGRHASDCPVANFRELFGGYGKEKNYPPGSTTRVPP